MKTDSNSLAALAKKFNRSGLSVSRFCLQHGIEVTKFKKIINRSKYESQPVGIFYPLLLVESDKVLYPVIVPKH
jgi:hypothetical protein